MQKVQEYYGEEMKDEQVDVVYRTSDYSQFKFISGNRPVNSAHKENLKKSLQVKQIPSPIIVNEKFEIADGQNRFQACKELNLPIYYIVVENITMGDVQRLNTNSKKWVHTDWLHHYSVRGFKNYLIYNEYQKKYQFGHEDSLSLLYWPRRTSSDLKMILGNMKYHALSAGATVDFKNGELKIDNYDESCFLAEQILLAAPFYKGYKRRNFVYALLNCFENKEYDHNTFIHKLSQQSEKLTDQLSTADYLQKIEKIYNFQSRNRVRLYYQKL